MLKKAKIKKLEIIITLNYAQCYIYLKIDVLLNIFLDIYTLHYIRSASIHNIIKFIKNHKDIVKNVTIIY